MLRRALLALLAFAAVAAAGEPSDSNDSPQANRLTLSARSEKHVRETHFADGRRSRGKSLFLPGTDLRKLVKAAEKSQPRRQDNGRYKRVATVGDTIGSDGRSGKPMKTYVVIAEPGGAVVTLYPGR